MSKNLTITEKTGERLRQLRGKALWAALATLIDAEGSIELVRDGTNYWSQIKIGNTVRAWLESWQARVDRGRIAKGELRPNGEHMWRWIIGKKADVAFILKRILPYLFVKIEQAEISLEFIEKKGIYRLEKGGDKRATRISTQELAWREDCWKRMRILNAKGHPERLYVEHPEVDGDIVRTTELSVELDDNALVQ